MLINVIPLLPWALLFLLFLPKSNRRWKAWIVLIPIIFVHISIFLFEPALSLVISDISQIAGWLAFGMAFILLLSYKLESSGRLVIFFISVLIMAVVGLLNVFSHTSLSFSLDALMYLMIYGSAALILFAGMGITRLLNRVLKRRWNTLKHFIFKLPLGLSLVSIVFVLISSVIMTFSGIRLGWWGKILNDSLFYGIILGIVLYFILFPFLIMAYYNSIYRARLQSVFGFEIVVSRLTDPSNEQKKRRENRISCI